MKFWNWICLIIGDFYNDGTVIALNWININNTELNNGTVVL